MTEFANKSFSVYPGARGGEQYRDNWDRVFGKKGTKEEEAADAENRWEKAKENPKHREGDGVVCDCRDCYEARF